MTDEIPKQEVIPAGAPLGRPLTFSADIAEEICTRLALGESLAAICRDDHMPCRVTVYSWLRKFDDFLNDYTRAREDQGHTSADEIIEIRNMLMRGEISHNQARVAIDSLKWEAGKRLPKIYGDKLDLSSSDGTMSPGVATFWKTADDS